MRVIGNIEHPDLKITVFKMEDRISVKFENAGYEQTYKIGADDRLNNLEAIRRWIDSNFLNAVLSQMRHMHQTRLAADVRCFPPETAQEFEDII